MSSLLFLCSWLLAKATGQAFATVLKLALLLLFCCTEALQLVSRPSPDRIVFMIAYRLLSVSTS